MLRQYSPPRFRYEFVGNVPRAVGTVPVGTIFRCSPDGYRRERSMIVEAWLPREIGAGRRCWQTGLWANAYVARGGHLAQVRCLATGRRNLLADHFIRFCVDHE